jgi:hypothetical protein
LNLKIDITTLNYNNAGVLYESYSASGFLTLIFNEPIWIFINILLKELIPDPVTGVRVIVFVGSFLSCYVLIKSISEKNRSVLITVALSMLFMLSPSFIKNYITHLRQGLAIGIFMLGMSFQGLTRIVLVAMAPFIHSSFFF